MTKITNYEHVLQFISQYGQSAGLSPDTIYRFIDYAQRRIWKTVAPTRPTDFRVSAVLSHGSRLPVDWTVWAGSAFYTDINSKVRAFHYIHPGQIAYELTNTAGGATISFPAIYFEDMALKTVPSGLTGITTWYFNRPVTLEGDAVPDAADDGMPGWVSSFVHMEAAQALREMSEDEQTSDETLIRRQKESLDINDRLFGMFVRAMQGDMRAAIKQ